MGFSLNLGNLEVWLTGDNSKFAKMLRNTETLMGETEKKMKKVGKTLTKYVTLPLTIMGAASVKAFSDFDSAMTQSLAIMGNVTPQMRKQMEDVAKTISSKSVKSADELARSYFFLASAGLDVQQSMGALPVVTNFATAGMFDMSLATDLLTDAQSALGLTVKDSIQNMKNMTRVSDVLVKANTLANASVEQFSTSLTAKAGTAMKSYNIDLEEGTAVLAAYADQGIKAQLAGNMFDRMLRLTIKSINDNRSVWDKWNITVEDAQGNLPPLADLLEQIHNRTKDMGAVQKAAALEMLGFQARSQAAILPLLGLSENIRRYERELRSAGGITDEVAQKQLKAFSAQMKILWNNVKLAGIEIGALLAPAILFLTRILKGAVNWFRGLSKTTKTLIVGFASFAAIIGPVLVGLGMFVGTIGFIIANVGILLIGLKAIVFVLGLVAAGIKLVWLATGIFPLIAVAIWAIVDAFTEADLGVIKFFDSIKINGFSVLKWMKIFSARFWRLWDNAVHRMKVIWEGWRLMIKSTLFNSEKAWKEYYDKIDKLNKKNVENQKKWNKELRDLIGPDVGVGAAAITTVTGGLGIGIPETKSKATEEVLEVTKTIKQEWMNITSQIEKMGQTGLGVTQDILSGIFEQATDPEAQALGAGNEQMMNLFGQRLQMQQQYGEQYLAMSKQIAESSLEPHQKAAAQQMAIDKHKRAVMLSGMSALLSASISLLTSGGRKQFKLYKALAIAEATVATYSAANKALNAGPIPNPGLAAAIIIMGLARVRQIAMTKPGGGFSGVGGTTATFGVAPTARQTTEDFIEKDDEEKQDKVTIIIENVHGTADTEFAKTLAQEIKNLSGDGVDYGLATTTN